MLRMLLFALCLILILSEGRKYHNMDSGRLDSDVSATPGEQRDVVDAMSGENRVSTDDADEMNLHDAHITRADRQKRALCGHIIGDRLCFLPPFKWRCQCGVAGCLNGHCQCKFCG